MGFRMRCAHLVAGAWIALTSVHASGALYSYVDKDGVLHFTNLPEDPRTRPHQKKGKDNTFVWKDPVGRLRTVHRIDVIRYDGLILEAAKYYSLPPELIKAMVAVESSFESAAVSHAGARGLMQLIPSTARAMAVRDVFDPKQNIYGGCRYLRLMANRFEGNVALSVAAYNAGPEAVERAGGMPPLTETQRYVQRVLRLFQYYLETWDRT